MQVERGVEAAGLRLRLIVQSADGTTHSAMSDEAERFNLYLDEVSSYATRALLDFALLRPPAREVQ